MEDDEDRIVKITKRVVTHAKQLAIFTAMSQQILLIGNDPSPTCSSSFITHIVGAMRRERDMAYQEIERLAREEPIPLADPYYLLGVRRQVKLMPGVIPQFQMHHNTNNV